MVLSRLRAASLVLVAGALLACSDDDADPQGNTAELRMVHADPAAGPIDVEVGGEVVLQDVAYGTTSAPASIPAGVQHVVLRTGSGVLAQLDEEMSEQRINSLLLSAGGAQFATQVIADTGAAATNRANIRMVNVVGANTEDPVLLDVKLTAPAPDSVMTFGLDTRIASYGTLMYFDPGQFTMKFQPQGSPTVLTEVTFAVAAGEVKAVVLERAEDGGYSASVVVED